MYYIASPLHTHLYTDTTHSGYLVTCPTLLTMVTASPLHTPSTQGHCSQWSPRDLPHTAHRGHCHTSAHPHHTGTLLIMV